MAPILLTPRQVSEALSYSIKHVRRLARMGVLPPFIKLGPGRCAMRSDLLDAWIEERANASAQDWLFTGKQEDRND